MKLRIVIIALCLAGNLVAQEKETVYSITVERHELEWYQTQITLWKQELDKDDKNGEAWWNYYAAARGAKNVAYPDEELRNKYFELCNEIAKDVKLTIPNTFEGHYIAYWNTTWSDEKYDELLKAYNLKPNDSRTYNDVMIYYELQGMPEEMNKIAKRSFEKNTMPAGMLNWAYNVLSELEENAVIFSAGDNDTYALWIVQQAKDFRMDVTVVNTSLVQLDDYRSLLMQNLAFPDYKLENTEESMTGMWNHFFKNKNETPVYVSASAMGQFEDSIWRENLYLTGLAYKYCENSFDNMGVIRRNFEKKYLLDHIKMGFGTHVADERATHFKGLYTPMLIKLYNHYVVTGESEKKDNVGDLLKLIGRETGRFEDIETLLKSDFKDC